MTRVRGLRNLAGLTNYRLLPIIARLDYLSALIAYRVRHLSVQRIMMRVQRTNRLETIMGLRINRDDRLIPYLLNVFLNGTVML